MIRIIDTLSRLSDANLQVAAKTIISSLTNNPSFPNPDPDLPAVNALLDQFTNAVAVAKDGAHSAIVERRSIRENLVVALRQLSKYVEYAAAGDEVKLASSGFTLSRPHGVRPDIQQPTNLHLEDGPNSGDLLLTFNRVADARSYLYEWTKDPLTESSIWQKKTGTTTECILNGLESGKRYWCRIGAVGVNGQIVYSEAISRLVQ